MDKKAVVHIHNGILLSHDPVCKTGKKTQMCIMDFWTQRERERERNELGHDMLSGSV